MKEELGAIQSGKTTVRAAELATILRFSGGLHVISGRIAVESEVESEQLAKRIRKDIAELYGVRAEITIVSASGVRRTSHYLVRVLDGGETLARQTGLRASSSSSSCEVSVSMEPSPIPGISSAGT